MKIINIDEALKLPQTFNVLNNAMEELYQKRQEEFQKSNPLKEIYQTYNLNQFQKSFGSSTGFKQAFERTVDYAAYPGFSSGDGFKATVSYKPFNGKVVFSWQTILEGDLGGIKEELSNFQIAWQRQLVEYGMYALTAFFGGTVYDKVSKTTLKIRSADTTDGDVLGDNKNPVFTNVHTVVKSDGMTADEFNALKQSNKFYVDIKLDGTDPLAPAKLANALYQIKVRMAKYLDDNGKRAGVTGRKKIVATEDAQLNSVLNCILAADDFSREVGTPTLNQVKDGFDKYFTPYLDGNFDQAIPQFATDDTVGYARGLMILDNEYNRANHGPMMIERVGFSMKAVKTEEPEGIKYLAKQAFDFACPSWRGVVYLYIGKPLAYGDVGYVEGAWNDIATFTEIVPVVYAKPIQIVNGTTNPVHVDMADGDTVNATVVNSNNNPVNTRQITTLIAPTAAISTNTLTITPASDSAHVGSYTITLKATGKADVVKTQTGTTLDLSTVTELTAATWSATVKANPKTVDYAESATANATGTYVKS